MTDRSRRAAGLRSVPAGYQFGDAARAEPVAEAVAVAPVVGIPEQFWIADYFKDRAPALKCAETIAPMLLAALRSEGLTTFTAPAGMPQDMEFLKLEGPVRVIVMWIPSWSPSEHAGKWACRADTLASGKAEV